MLGAPAGRQDVLPHGLRRQLLLLRGTAVLLALLEPGRTLVQRIGFGRLPWRAQRRRLSRGWATRPDGSPIISSSAGASRAGRARPAWLRRRRSPSIPRWPPVSAPRPSPSTGC